jgi:membrane associated rhomboid family serine protease
MKVADGLYAGQSAIDAIEMTPTVGASGAIYGVLMGHAMLYSDSILRLIFPPIALKAKWFVLIFAAIELVTGMTGTGGGIAHFAHLGGLIFGFLLIIFWKKRHTLYSRMD